MSIEKINLRKLLQLLFADDRLRRRLLRADIRSEIAKEDDDSETGGDFYTPFWSDVKDHVVGRSDITEQTNIRILKNKTRARLYPRLRDGFLNMWNEKMRWRNEPFEFTPTTIKAQLKIKELGTIVKIENTASVETWDGSHRVIYPYFSEEPSLPEDGARLGFWVLETALPQFNIDEFRIVDIQRRAYFRPAEVEMRGDEEKRFLSQYAALLKEWRKLKKEYS